MRRIREDLWETEACSPFEELTTHAYLRMSPASGNVLFYAPCDDTDLAAIDRLGGVDRTT